MTQALRKDILLFTNHIADIVHKEIDRHGGSVNKNLGESFLVVWKLGPEFQQNTVSYNNKGQEIIDVGLKDISSNDKSLTYIAE